MDYPQTQRAFQGIRALLREGLNPYRLLQHALRLRDHLRAYCGHQHLVLTAFEYSHTQFIFQVFHRRAEARLADEGARRGAAEMLGFRDGNDVFQFGEGHFKKHR